MQIILPGSTILFLTSVNNTAISEDTFVVERANDDGFVHFRSFASDTHYIRVANDRLTLAIDDGSAQFDAGSSFLIRRDIGAAPLTIRETNAKLQAI